MGGKSRELVAKMTVEEKAALCAGRDFWYLKGIPRLGLEPVMVTDGPHGLRKQAPEEGADHLGINRSVPAVCFPTAAATACSFDRALLEEVGQALGEECQAEKVGVILGPGVNIKRSPLCGRNFEYFSEDPLVGGELAAALIRGVQSRGAGTSLKHFAANNQEKRRMTVSAVVDERALREIYLAGFERAVKQGRPWTVMCSYNRINGVYASENRKLLTEILRDEWGFEGLVMTDWGAANDRIAGLRAGLDLEMPGPGRNEALIVEAVKSGALEEAVLDTAVERVTDLILAVQEAQKARGAAFAGGYDAAAHQALARRAARESAVLLKNDGILPLKQGRRAALIGAFAKEPRYQGAGSSRINPTLLENPFDALKEGGLDFDYAAGYALEPGAGADPVLIEAACAAARGKEAVLIFAGLPGEYESEGFDRDSLSLPESHNRLIEAVAAVNPNTVVVLQCGAPVTMPWAASVKAILLAWLGGQAGGGACADLLLGKVSPSGKLAETFPQSLEQTPCFANFPGNLKTVEYRESIFVGYRYYDTAKETPAWPFGYGLSYTSFAYRDLRLEADSWRPGETLKLSLEVQNTGAADGAEIVQLYLAYKNSRIPRPRRELRGFEKVSLHRGETKRVNFSLDDRAFAYYNVPAGGWAVEGGPCVIEIGASSRDIRLTAEVSVTGDGKESLLSGLRETAAAYYPPALDEKPWRIPDRGFEALLGAPLPPARRQSGEPFTLNTTLCEIQDHPAGKAFVEAVSAGIGEGFGSGDIGRMIRAMLADMPLRSLLMMGGGRVPEAQVHGLLKVLNGE